MSTIKKLVKLEHDATNFGFSWEKPQQIMAQIQSECEEVKAHLSSPNQKELQNEIGDLLHAVFSLCVFCNFDPEETLSMATDKFAERLKHVKQIARDKGLSNLKGRTFDELMEFWSSAKALEK